MANAPQFVEYEGNRFDLRHPRCSSEIGCAIIRGNYEAREINLIKRFVMPDDRVLELGACMGVTSLVLHDIVGRDGHLVVEADMRNRDLAQHMFELNGKDVRMAFGFLVSGDTRPDQVEFASNSNPSSSSIIDRDGTEEKFSVPTMSFEDVIEKERSTVLVLDIEGGEYELFTKARHFGNLRTIQLEAHDWVLGDQKMQEMLQALSRHGFVVDRSYIKGRYLVFNR